MRVTTSKSKNAESFYISKGFINDKGVSTSVIVRKLGTLKDLLPKHGPTRDDVMAWAKFIQGSWNLAANALPTRRLLNF